MNFPIWMVNICIDMVGEGGVVFERVRGSNV